MTDSHTFKVFHLLNKNTRRIRGIKPHVRREVVIGEEFRIIIDIGKSID